MGDGKGEKKSRAAWACVRDNLAQGAQRGEGLGGGEERRGCTRVHLGLLPGWAPGTEPAGRWGAAPRSASSAGQRWMRRGWHGWAQVQAGSRSSLAWNLPPRLGAKPDPGHLLLRVHSPGLCHRQACGGEVIWPSPSPGPAASGTRPTFAVKPGAALMHVL